MNHRRGWWACWCLVVTAGLSAAGTASAYKAVSTGIPGYFPAVSGNTIAFMSYEGDSGEDLNGDGDAEDFSMSYYDVSTGAVGHCRDYSEGRPAISGNIIAYTTDEWGQGQDLDGDGQLSSRVVTVCDVATGTSTSTGIASGSYVYNGVSASGSILAFDSPDGIIQYYDVATGQLGSTGAYGVEPSIGGSVIAYSDYYTGWTMRYYDIATGALTNTGVFGLGPWVSGSMIVFWTQEGNAPFGTDLDGDGYGWDGVVASYDLTTGAVQAIVTDAGIRPTVSGSVIAFTAVPSGTIAYHDMSTGVTTDTGLNADDTFIGGSIIAGSANEWEWGTGADLNGDGDTWDWIIVYVDIDASPTIESVASEIDSLLASGGIDNAGVAEAFQAFLEQAQARIDRGNVIAATNTLEALANSVEAQAGQHLTTQAADTLLADIAVVIDGL